MDSKSAVRPKQPNSVPTLGQLAIGVIFLIGALLVELFTDKEADDERRKQQRLAMKQAIEQATSQALDAVAGSLASGLNVLLQAVTCLQGAAGIQVGLPVTAVTAEDVIIVAQWILLLLVIYGVIAITYLLATYLLSWLWWLLKVGVALACFGLILKDDNVGTETTVIRLVCLGSVCFLLSVKPWKDRAMAAKTVHLEKQAKILENQLRQMQKWKRRFVSLSACLVVFVVVGVFIVLSA